MCWSIIHNKMHLYWFCSHLSSLHARIDLNNDSGFSVAMTELVLQLESSHSPHTSAYLRQGNVVRQVASPYSLCQRFPYAPFNAMVTKISKWSRIQDFCRITPKIESLVAYAMPDIPSTFQKDLSITFWVILLTHRQTDRQTKTGKNITSLTGFSPFFYLTLWHLHREL